MVSRRRFTKEFKTEVVQQVGIRPAAEICREYDIQQNLLSRWKKEYEIDPGDAFQGNGKLWKEDAKLAHSQRLLGQAYMEIDFLKKNIENLRRLHLEEQRKRVSTR
ncbi:MAG: IS3/IS66 family element, Orf1 protein [Rhodocyclaceae bacterium]|nr:MAG: IS3/IS66 family element, Orf1 protein [Rhodocyclaceae bacterium]